jgi:hypothetical protein
MRWEFAVRALNRNTVSGSGRNADCRLGRAGSAAAAPRALPGRLGVGIRLGERHGLDALRVDAGSFDDGAGEVFDGRRSRLLAIDTNRCTEGGTIAAHLMRVMLL